MLTLTHLLEEAKCYDSVRKLRWPNGTVRCPKCGSDKVVKRGKDDTHPHRQRYHCKGCQRQCDRRSPVGWVELAKPNNPSRTSRLS